MKKIKANAYIYVPVQNEAGDIVALRRGHYNGYKMQTPHGPLFIADTANKKHNKAQRLYTVADLDTGVRLDYWQPTIAAAFNKGVQAFEKLGDNLAAARLQSQRLVATLPIQPVN